jgi:hypothetical protein
MGVAVLSIGPAQSARLAELPRMAAPMPELPNPGNTRGHYIVPTRFR